MNKHILLVVLIEISVSAIPFSSVAKTTSPDENLKVVINRHGEKPESGNNLSCQGENRALQLVRVLSQKFNKPDFTYVPSMKLGKTTKHARMFQTVTPIAIKYNLSINSQFDAEDYEKISAHILKKAGTLLMVWRHSAIQPLAKELGVDSPPPWEDDDFDSIWIITFEEGKASLLIDKEAIDPSPECGY